LIGADLGSATAGVICLIGSDFLGGVGSDSGGDITQKICFSSSGCVGKNFVFNIKANETIETCIPIENKIEIKVADVTKEIMVCREIITEAAKSFEGLGCA